ncbi:MAG: BTAD domain-containing putative transcriptional regulator [Cyanobacteria bacterium J06635_15]
MTVEKPPLQINLLGDFCLIDQSATVIELRLRSQQLLAYLILHRHTPQPRRRIAGQLWPDALESQARTNLRKELHHLRQACPMIDQLITVTHQTLHWQPQVPCNVDLETFETNLAVARDTGGDSAVQALEAALEVYRDDLWPDCDADWIYPEQVRLRQQYVRALAQITGLLQGLGKTTKAIALGQQWLQAEPLEEGAYQTLMRLYGEMGDRATALRLYYQCMTTLQTELGVNPSPTTANIYQQLLTAEDRIAAPIEEVPERPISAQPDSQPDPILPVPLPLSAPGSAEPMVGREHLFQTLKQWLLSPLGIAAPLLLLTGEPGIGKTRLLEALADQATAHHWQAYWGRAFAAEQLRSYGVWIDLLRAAPLPKRLPNLEEPSIDLQSRGQLLDAMVQGLSTVVSPEQPLLLLFDDIHWLDEASTTLLHYVFRLLGQRPLRIACAAREQELQANPAALTLVKSLRRAQRIQEVAVPPLSPEAVFELVKPLLNQKWGESPGEEPVRPLSPQQIYVDSGGNPLFALEATRASYPETSNLSNLIDDRLQRLDGAARDLLPWAAALGRRFNPEILAVAASYPPMQFLTAMEQLEQQQIVCPTHSNQVDEQGNYDFIHDLVRQVAYDQLSQPRRRIIHGQLAKTLAAQMVEDDLASQVAYHAGLAGNHALAAHAYTAAAARSLRLFAYQDVIQLVAEGLHHCQYLPSRDRLLSTAQLLHARVFAGVAPEDATTVEYQLQQLLADIVGLSIPEAEVMAQGALNFLNYEQGKLTTVHRQTLTALDTLPPSPRLQVESLATNGCCLTEIERDMDRAEAVLLEAQSLASRLGLMLIDIPTGLGCVERYHGNYLQARAYLQQALQLAQNQQDFGRQGYALTHLAMAGWDGHQPEIAEAQALLALSTQLPKGSDGTFAQALITLSAYKDEGNAEPLNQALQQLDQLDAQRKIVFIAGHASELALAHHQSDAAQYYAATAHQAAKQIDHPNDLVAAVALLVLTTPKERDQLTYWQALQSIVLNSQPLSARAESLRHRAEWFMQQLISKPN